MMSEKTKMGYCRWLASTFSSLDEILDLPLLHAKSANITVIQLLICSLIRNSYDAQGALVLS